MSVRTGTNDAALLHSGDPEDFGVFYRRHADAVTSYVGRRVRQPDVVFDLVAETFARALVHRDRYDPGRGPAVAWLFTIARNQLIDASRRGRVVDDVRRRLRFERVELDDADLARVDERVGTGLDDALASLPDDQRAAVVARFLAEEDYPVIAQRLRCSEQVVRQRVSRGLATLRRRMKEQS